MLQSIAKVLQSEGWCGWGVCLGRGWGWGVDRVCALVGRMLSMGVCSMWYVGLGGLFCAICCVFVCVCVRACVLDHVVVCDAHCGSALLTIAGYSVNDTVVVFDRIRERTQQGSDLPLKLQVDQAVSATLTRTLYTSGTTLMPLLALVFFGGSTLYWFAIALALGVVVGSWSSIALAPSLLTLWQPQGD